jgi:small GTP-binding protein
MLGLDNAGKTSILYHLKLEQHIKTIPTVGFNVESIEYKNIRLCVYDAGGQERIRVLWKHYYEDVNAIIFVVDSADRERLKEAKHALDMVLNDPRMDKILLLVWANKQDLSDAASVDDITEALNLKALNNKRKWRIQPCSSLKSFGLYEGLDWLSNALTSQA